MYTCGYIPQASEFKEGSAMAVAEEEETFFADNHIWSSMTDVVSTSPTWRAKLTTLRDLSKLSRLPEDNLRERFCAMAPAVPSSSRSVSMDARKRLSAWAYFHLRSFEFSQR